MNNQHKIVKNNSLPGPISLLKQTWKIYRRNFKILLVLSLLVSFGSLTSNIFLPFLDGISFKSEQILAVPIVIAIVGLISFWGFVATLYAIKEENGIDIREALSKGLKKLFPNLWVITLSIFIMLGGFFLFVIPGIIFLVWFYMSNFVLVAENVGGMSALLKSRNYVRGYFWAVAGRILFVWIISILTFWAPIYLFKLLHLPPYVNSIYSFIYDVLSTPFYLIYGFLLYKHLKSIKEEATFRSSSKNKAFFIVCGVLGAIIPIILIMFWFFSPVPQKSPKTQFNYKLENPIRENVEEIQSALGKYYSDHGQYPPSLEDLTPEYLSSIPLVLGAKQEYYYVLQENGKKYKLCGDKFRAICVSH